MPAETTDKPNTPGRTAPATGIMLRAQLHGTRVLILHPDQVRLDHIQWMLGQHGITHLTLASCPDKALQYLQAAPDTGSEVFDAILVSASLPDDECHHTCRELRRQAGVDVPIIILGDSGNSTEQQYCEAGATDVWPAMEDSGLAHCLTLLLLLKLERTQSKQRDQQLRSELIERKGIEARLQYLVAHDELTGLYNRRRMGQLLELALINAQHNQRTSALLYLDLDQFRLINDAAGHSVGDKLLIEITHIMRRHINPESVLARIGSDAFVLLLENVTIEQVIEQANTLRRALDGFRFETSIKNYHISLSIGVALIEPHETLSADEVLARADQACYVAKAHGRNRVHLFSSDDSSMHLLQSDAYWAQKIRHALAHDMLCLLFQPIVSAHDGIVRHYEALVRLIGDQGELITPAHFIPVAERISLIHEIDMWVTQRAIQLLAKQAPRQSGLVININLSTQVLQHSGLLPLTREIMAKTGVEGQRITFEITETAAIASLAQTQNMLSQLRTLGCNFALDDFGAGFNSYSYLKHFPVDYLKIDGTFITNLVYDPVDQALVKSMIEVAHALGKKTVAEFVENAETLALLKSYGIDYVQGYYLGKPEHTFLT
ncbi:MAG: EAL domain-containing protein [Gammaproteobacteria bacterium]|nr:EAL domain-containing protein [Gammaproteobacteria bacterium]